MYDLLTKPEGFYDSVKRTTASLSTITLFGHRALELTDYWGSVCCRRYLKTKKGMLLTYTGRVPLD